jgi:hypothetical protein
MRALLRNKVEFYYSVYKGKEPQVDEYGNQTGEYKIIRADPIRCEANISAAKGEISTRQFGESETYDKVIVLDDINTPIDEYTVMWVDSLDITKPYDYIVKKVAKSLNSVSIAINKVDVS